jgi:hypothetical protein
MSKLGLDNRVQLAAYAAQHGLTEPPGSTDATSS